jgi:hypothetical protein
MISGIFEAIAIFEAGLDFPEKFGPRGTWVMNEEVFSVLNLATSLLFSISYLLVMRIANRRRFLPAWISCMSGFVIGGASVVINLFIGTNVTLAFSAIAPVAFGCAMGLLPVGRARDTRGFPI